MLEWLRKKLHAARIGELEYDLKLALLKIDDLVHDNSQIYNENRELLRENGQMAKLEAQCERLVDENRQLVNSILTSLGMPGVEGPRSNKPVMPIPRNDWDSYRRRKEREHATPVQFDAAGNPIVPKEAPAAPEGKAAVVR